MTSNQVSGAQSFTNSGSSQNIWQLTRASVDGLAQAIESGNSQALSTYLGVMARFHSYSARNALLIAAQFPSATHLEGVRSWNELGRFVRPGEKGIYILAPMLGTQPAAPAKTDGKPKSRKQQKPQTEPQPKPPPWWSRKLWPWNAKIPTRPSRLSKPCHPRAPACPFVTSSMPDSSLENLNLFPCCTDSNLIMMHAITTWLSIALPAILGSLLFVPWQVNDHRCLPKHLGMAPLWSHRFDQVPGAKVDRSMTTFVLIIIALLSAAPAVLSSAG